MATTDRGGADDRAAARYWLGIDIGGTFTDFALFDTASGELLGLKVPSTPPAFADGVRTGLDQLARDHGVDLRAIGAVVHGTTIAVNTLIQRAGARLGLLVTDGFRDVLELQRLRLPNPFDLDGARPLPLIPRSRVVEVRERLRADGRVDTPLDETSVHEGVRALRDQGAESLVVSLLHSYRNPAHERRVVALAAALTGLPVSASADVWPQAREYERTALAVLDAYVQPPVRGYLEGFEQALAERGVPAVPYVTKSNGGIMPVAAARERTVETLLSGPASGVIGAAYVAAQAGLRNVITLDVGAPAPISAGHRARSTRKKPSSWPLITSGTGHITTTARATRTIASTGIGPWSRIRSPGRSSSSRRASCRR